jgi:uncharacterized phage protein gp47/JayE
LFAIPTLEQLVNRARNAFRANLPGSDAWLWPNNVNPTAKVIGGMASELFGFADNIQRQKFAITADGPDLDLHGAEIGLPRNGPQSSSGFVTVTVADSFQVAFGAVFQGNDGVQFSATAAAAIAGPGTLNVPVQSVGTGSATVTLGGTPLSIVSGCTDVNGDAFAGAAAGSGGITGGADTEPDGAYFNPPPGTYRYRILFKKRNPPMGGAAADYVIWCQAANPNVTRVYVERLWTGAGTVRVFPLMDGLYANGIPQSADIAQISAFLSTVQPSGAVVTTAAATAVPVNITVQGLTPSNAATQSAVQNELATTFLRLSQVAGSDVYNPAMPYLAVPFSFLAQWLQQAVDNATGVTSGKVTVPSADIALTAGQLATLGSLSFV